MNTRMAVDSRSTYLCGNQQQVIPRLVNQLFRQYGGSDWLIVGIVGTMTSVPGQKGSRIFKPIQPRLLSFLSLCRLFSLLR